MLEKYCTNTKFVKFFFTSLICFILIGNVAAVFLLLKTHKQLKNLSYNLLSMPSTIQKDISSNVSSAVQNGIKQAVQDAIELNAKREQLANYLKVYTAFNQHEPLKLVRPGRSYDGGYVTAVEALQASDVLMGYGIADDNSFEEAFSDLYNKPSYGFDCGVSNVTSKNKLFTFVNECIADDTYLYSTQKSSQKISSFSKQIDNLGLADKKIFIKMDIEGAEYNAFDEILKNHSNITGIVLEIHFSDKYSTDQAIKLLRKIDKNFLLIHAHANNCCASFMTKNSVGVMSGVMELSYINKSLVTSYSLAQNQSHPLAIDMPNLADRKEVEFEMILDN